MKKTLLIITIIIFQYALASAQLQRHGFNLSIGGFSSNFFDAVSEDIRIDPTLDGPVSKKIGEQTGSIFVTYRYFPSGRFSIGISGGIERVKGDIQVNAEDVGIYYNDYLTGAIEFDYRYISRPRIQLYSGGGLGIIYNEEKNEFPFFEDSNEEFKLAYQANIIGFRYGGIFGAFLEAGYGYKGILKFGLNIQL
jgi:hypothetical protein